MAQAVARVRSAGGQTQVVARFIGATSASTDPVIFLRAFAGRSRSYTAGVGQDPVARDELELEFRRLLALPNQDRPLVIFIDAVDQLSLLPGVPGQPWIPARLPGFVASCCRR